MITIFLSALFLDRSCFDYSFLIPMYAKSRISPIEIFSAFYTQFHDFFRFVDYHYRVPAPAACTYPGYVCGAWMCVPCPGCVYRACCVYPAACTAPSVPFSSYFVFLVLKPVILRSNAFLPLVEKFESFS